MLPDFISQIIEQHDGFHQSCNNCDKIYGKVFNNGYICSGIVRHPKKLLPFDIIRICDGNERGGYWSDYTPDEALLTSEMLTSAVRKWMVNTEPYRNFRGLENYES